MKGVKRKTWKPTKAANHDIRVDVFVYFVIALAIIIAGRLFLLQVIQHGFYEALASTQHELYQELVPERGEILVHDYKDGTLVPVATNQQLAFVYAEPRHIEEPQEVAAALGEIFGYEEEKIERLADRLGQPEDPYEPIARNVSDADLDRIIGLAAPGIRFIREESRLYPEPGMGGHIIGFMGMNSHGERSGKYGIEGYFEEELAGIEGFIHSEKDIAGRLIATGERAIERAVDGVDIVLTIDRTIQYEACAALDRAVAHYQADGGSVIIIDPTTGKVFAMCGSPNFEPSDYSEIKDISDFNNPGTFNAYEPGSIFKPVAMAAGIDTGAVKPTSTFIDDGFEKIDEYTIKNAEEKVYGVVTMIEVLEDSINTGMIHVMRETGRERLVDYIKAFGFGVKTGIQLETEVAGDISPLEINHEIYAATASYGQGITVTPLQMVAAYAAIANGGILKKPYIVDEVRYATGDSIKTDPTEIRRVIESKTARQLGAMLISVIDNGQAEKAAVEGYYLGGKTGTAQVAKTTGAGYKENETIASFVGFGPVEDPKFVMLTRIDNPRTVPWASQTAAPLFGEIADFLLDYFEVAPTRPVNRL